MAKHYSRQFWIWGKIQSWTMQRPPMNSLKTLCMVWPLRPLWVSLKPTSDGLNWGKGFQYDASPKTPASVPVWSSCARHHGPETKLKDCICSCCGRNGGMKALRIDNRGLCQCVTHYRKSWVSFRRLRSNLEGLQGTVYVLPYFRTPPNHPEMAVTARKSAHLSSK